MKARLKEICINFLALFLLAEMTKGISYANSPLTLFWAAFSLYLLNWLVKPLLNLLLMPINLVTLGALKWLINAVVFFLVTLFVANFKITNFTFPGISISGFVIPSVTITFFWALILISFMFEIIVSAINWLFN